MLRPQRFAGLQFIFIIFGYKKSTVIPSELRWTHGGEGGIRTVAESWFYNGILRFDTKLTPYALFDIHGEDGGAHLFLADLADLAVDVHRCGELRVAEQPLRVGRLDTRLNQHGREGVAQLVRGAGHAGRAAVGVVLFRERAA